MRTIRRTVRFKRDYKREARGRYRATLDRELLAAVSLLAADARLPDKYRDHALTGDWTDHRDCHIRPDLVLIYRKPDLGSLELYAWVPIANSACSAAGMPGDCGASMNAD